MQHSLVAEHLVAVMDAAEEGSEEWLARFHAGDRQVLTACYQDHFATVDAAVGRHVKGADRETVVHDVFYTLVSSSRARQSFHGGSLGAWLTTVARNRAIDHLRSHGRLKSIDPHKVDALPGAEPDPADQVEARLLIEQFRRDHLPDKWVAVFDVRFLRQLSQREAAAHIGCSRTTLAYQEHQVRRLLRRFLLHGEARR